MRLRLRGGAATGKSEAGIPREVLLQSMRADLKRVRQLLDAAGIAFRGLRA